MSALDVELTALCHSCGLCCDGSLFGRVDLEPDEVEPARGRGLRVVGNGRVFEQPCAALVPIEAAAEMPGRTCKMYDHRPASCRRFVCRLHDRHRREGGPLEPRLAAVRRVRQLLASLERGPRAPELVEELTKRVEDDFARA